MTLVLGCISINLVKDWGDGFAGVDHLHGGDNFFIVVINET
jgi:hypothetical protein